ncbi:MAG TPA: hypothetical protein VGK90_00520, partial [Rhizomicrobium sp.]
LPGMASADSFKPMFLARHNDVQPSKEPVTNLPQWNGTYTDLTGKTINFTQIGGNPSNTNTTSTITVLLIPIKMVFGSSNGNMTLDPMKVKLANNKNRNVVKAMEVSPLFNSKVDFDPQSGSCSGSCVDLGKTQYEDAFQRGTWWGNAVGSNPNYHVLFTFKAEKELTINVSSSQGKIVTNEAGCKVCGTMDINAFDSQLQTFMKAVKDVNPGVLPLFITYDTYLTEGGCCVGGYHNANGSQPSGQTYSYATYVDNVGAFSQDVSAFSHELGEWMDDPFTDNIVNCRDNSLMEVGDPLEGLSNYGGFPYKDKGFTYNLQSLVYMGYFGAPTSDSANQWYALQNDMSHVCPGQ